MVQYEPLEGGTYRNGTGIMLHKVVQGFWHIPRTKQAYQQSHVVHVKIIPAALLLPPHDSLADLLEYSALHGFCACALLYIQFALNMLSQACQKGVNTRLKGVGLCPCLIWPLL